MVKVLRQLWSAEGHDHGAGARGGVPGADALIDDLLIGYGPES